MTNARCRAFFALPYNVTRSRCSGLSEEKLDRTILQTRRTRARRNKEGVRMISTAFTNTTSSHNRKSRGLMQRLTYRCFCLCLLVLLGSASLMADVTGSIQGYVRDSSGAVISGARVTVTER